MGAGRRERCCVVLRIEVSDGDKENRNHYSLHGHFEPRTKLQKQNPHRRWAQEDECKWVQRSMSNSVEC